MFKNTKTGLAVGKLDIEPCTLQIDTSLIRLCHKELEIAFELQPDKLKNVDTVIINGYKYIKVKEEYNMTIEQIVMRQEIRQILNEAGINKNTMKDLVNEVIYEELTKAVKQVMHEMDIDTIIHNKTNGSLQEAVRKELRASIDDRVRGVFNRMMITVDIKDDAGHSATGG